MQSMLTIIFLNVNSNVSKIYQNYKTTYMIMDKTFWDSFLIIYT